MEKKEIVITGKIDELVLCEFYLIMMGYDKPYEDWNNVQSVCYENNPGFIKAYEDGAVLYFPYLCTSTKVITAKQFLKQF